jgi:hypothetical protein
MMRLKVVEPHRKLSDEYSLEPPNSPSPAALRAAAWLRGTTPFSEAGPFRQPIGRQLTNATAIA